jgi:hypothetical protein
MSEMGPQILQPAQWSRPRGYSNGIVASGRQIFIAGQVGWDAQGRFNSERLADQVRQTLENICAVLAQARAGGKELPRDERRTGRCPHGAPSEGRNRGHRRRTRRAIAADLATA